MVDTLQATQDAIFAALDAVIPSDLALVRQAVKQDTQPPFVIVGDMDVEAAAKGSRFDRITIEVHSVYRGAARRGLLAIMAAVRDALDDQPLDDTGGCTFSTPSFISAGTALGDDGVTYAGVIQFEVFAEPA